MSAEIYQDRKQEWRWRLKARNGRILADSGEGYTRPYGARRALNNFIRDVRAQAVEVQE